MLQELLLNNLEAVVSVVLSVLGFLAAKGLSLLNRKVKNQVAVEALAQLASLVRSIARQLEQELVPELKKAAADGNLSAEDKKVLRDSFKAILKQQLSSQLVDSLKKVVGLSENQIDDAAVMMLEAYLNQKKHGALFGL